MRFKTQDAGLKSWTRTVTVLLFLVSWVLGLGSGVSLVLAAPREAHVAGAFYPADPQELRSFVVKTLEQYPAPDANSVKPRILISPHAGYPYSGVVAARAFREVQGRKYDAVVVVAFTHQDQFDGTSVDDRESYVTPLGTIPVEMKAVEFLKTQPRISHVERAHDSQEHSLEVMLPFLQVALGEFKLVPLLMGGAARADAEALAEALAKLAAQGDYLFVFSTDLSHYHSYEQALHRDEGTVDAILFETPQAVSRLFDLDALEACGRGPIATALFLSERLGFLERRRLLYANSGDTTGDKSRVVGYAAIAMYPRAPASGQVLISQEAGKAMVLAARQALESSLRQTTSSAPASLQSYSELQDARGLFVTLRKHGQLRGCIGRIDSDEPLAKLLPTVALDAALRDTRFSPVSANELGDLTVEVSVLTHPQRIQDTKEIVAGRDGVVLVKDGRSGVFLPQVWGESAWTRLEFLRDLATEKAGLASEAWQQAQLFTFQVQAFEEDR